MDKTEGHVCSICGVSFIGFGHNPEPIFPYEQRCCGDCNGTAVIPARMAFIGANTPEKIEAVEKKMEELREAIREARAN